MKVKPARNAQLVHVMLRTGREGCFRLCLNWHQEAFVAFVPILLYSIIYNLR